MFLKRSASDIERKGKLLSPPGKVFVKLPLGLNENRMGLMSASGFRDRFTQAHTMGTVVLPQHGSKAFVTRDEFQLSHGRFDRFGGKTHAVGFLVCDRASSALMVRARKKVY
jgi:hypothetical protein